MNKLDLMEALGNLPEHYFAEACPNETPAPERRIPRLATAAAFAACIGFVVGFGALCLHHDGFTEPHSPSASQLQEMTAAAAQTGSTVTAAAQTSAQITAQTETTVFTQPETTAEAEYITTQTAAVTSETAPVTETAPASSVSVTETAAQTAPQKPAPAEDLAEKLELLKNRDEPGLVSITLLDEPAGTQFGTYEIQDLLCGVVVYAEDAAALDWTIARNETLKDAGIQRSAYEQGGEHCWLLTVSTEHGGYFAHSTVQLLCRKLAYYQSGELLDLQYRSFTRPLCFTDGAEYCFDVILDAESSYRPTEVFAEYIDAERCTSEPIAVTDCAAPIRALADSMTENGTVVPEALSEAVSIVNPANENTIPCQRVRLYLRDGKDLGTVWALCKQMNREQEIRTFALLNTDYADAQYQIIAWNTDSWELCVFSFIFPERDARTAASGFSSSSWFRSPRGISESIPDGGWNAPYFVNFLMKWKTDTE